MFLEQLHRLQDQVVEVHRVVGAQGALVMQVDDRGGLLLGIAGLFQRLLRKDQVVLPGTDVVLDLVDAVVPEYSFCMMSVSSALMSDSSKIEKPGL